GDRGQYPRRDHRGAPRPRPAPTRIGPGSGQVRRSPGLRRVRHLAMPRVAGVVLAAGAATRIGGRKQLLTLGGRPILAYVLDAARRAPLDPLLVVLGSAASEIKAQVDLTGTQVVCNPRYREGQSTSVIAAVEALPDDVDAAVFLLGDQPEVAVPVLER